MDPVKITNVSNLVAFGAEWTGESGTTYQLVNPRGTTGLHFGAKREGGRWATVNVTDPERFGLTSPPTEYKHSSPSCGSTLTRSSTETPKTPRSNPLLPGWNGAFSIILLLLGAPTAPPAQPRRFAGLAELTSYRWVGIPAASARPAVWVAPRD